jgi:hypothetical protein
VRRDSGASSAVACSRSFSLRDEVLIVPAFFGAGDGLGRNVELYGYKFNATESALIRLATSG